MYVRWSFLLYLKKAYDENNKTSKVFFCFRPFANKDTHTVENGQRALINKVEYVCLATRESIPFLQLWKN